jgi:hypothetical protein
MVRHASILRRETHRGFFVGGSAQCSKNMGDSDREQKNTPSPKPKRKKLSTLSFLIGCMKFLFPKLFATIFNLG